MVLSRDDKMRFENKQQHHVLLENFWSKDVCVCVCVCGGGGVKKSTPQQ